ILIDAADPLSRLGLGLAKIREGDLPAGRQEIEVAAVLDTESSLVRSYLGKAYYEEKRDRLAQTQLDMAKTFDPKDPTPWFYQAILDQSENRPVASLEGLQKSIELNDNRAVYRSRLLLDQDQAARSIALARTYRMLGFDQLALLESVKSLSLDPSDSSAHRFLADSYSGQIRSEAARSSELLQAQLRQPLAVNTITPLLLTDRRQLVEGSGAVQASSREFTPLFNRNQVVARIDGLGGDHHTFGDQIFVSGLHDSIAFSGGQFHYETQGLRPNNDMRRDVYDAFVQVGLTPALRIQAELRDDRTRQGDLSSRFDPDDFSRDLRDEFRQQAVRIGGIYVIDPASNVVASAISGHGKERLFSRDDPSSGVEDRERLNAGEVQYVLKGSSFHLTTGLSSYTNSVALEDSNGVLNEDEKGRSIYASVVFTALPWGLRPELGLSVDTFEQAGQRVSRTDPKLGLLWTLSTDTTLRAAYFKTIKRSFEANQTLQPSQIFGFNQYFDDPNGTLSRGTGIALQHRLSATTFTGAQWSSRDSQVPGFPGDPYAKWTEQLARAYLYRVFNAHTAMTAEWQYELLRRPEDNPGNEAFTKVRTMLVPVALRFNLPVTWSAVLQLTYVDQKVQTVSLSGDLVDGRDKFAVADASVSYQLPGRNGFVSLEAKNLFDRRFQYQEIDSFSSPRVLPSRTVFLRFSASF
ncbi:MAG TPA: TonB-dependent receptor, partial [Candidatus Dormibacteraeota bacterium]|nr:TonB-dependent receptor [Candidatus Dormibacteraeota bacterium]